MSTKRTIPQVNRDPLKFKKDEFQEFEVVKYKDNYYQKLSKSVNTLRWTKYFNKRTKHIPTSNEKYIEVNKIPEDDDKKYRPYDIIKYKGKYFVLKDNTKINNKKYYWKKIDNSCKFDPNTKKVKFSGKIVEYKDMNNFDKYSYKLEGDEIVRITDDGYYKIVNMLGPRQNVVIEKIDFNPYDVGPLFDPNTCKEYKMLGTDGRVYKPREEPEGNYRWRKIKEMHETNNSLEYYSQFEKLKLYRTEAEMVKLSKMVKKLKDKLAKHKILLIILPWKNVYNSPSYEEEELFEHISGELNKDYDKTSYIYTSEYYIFNFMYRNDKIYLDYKLKSSEYKIVDQIFKDVFKNKYEWKKGQKISINI